MKSKEILIVAVVLAGCLGLLGWFAGGVSAVYDPIKTYRYSLTRDELQQKLIETVKANHNLTLKMTDTVGNRATGDLAYYADILFLVRRERYTFNIKFYKVDSFWNSDVRSEISLVGAFDNRQGDGGYIPEARGVDRITKVFETEVIEKLNIDTAD
jgi:hypothetical protein